MAHTFSAAIASSFFASLVFMSACNNQADVQTNTPELRGETASVSTDSESVSTIADDTVADTESDAEDEPTQGSSDESATTSASVNPGTYCFQFNDGITDSHISLTVNPDSTVSGRTEATIQDDENAYYTSYRQLLDGNLAGTQLTVTVTTAIELDTQQSQETWQLTSSSLRDERNTYTAVDCAQLTADNSPSDEPSSGIGMETLGIAPAQLANAVRVQFAPGTSSANLENSVVRGTRDVYVLGAQANQSMSVKITSLENNAVFDVLSPSNEVLRWESTDEELALSETGEYHIVVGGTRGNATYQLEVGIY